MFNCDTDENVTLKIAQQVATQSTVKTHQSCQHNNTVHLCCETSMEMNWHLLY